MPTEGVVCKSSSDEKPLTFLGREPQAAYSVVSRF